MCDATSPLPTDLPQRLANRTAAVLVLVADFIGGEPTPAATFAFEKKSPTSFAKPVGMFSTTPTTTPRSRPKTARTVSASAGRRTAGGA